MDGGTRGSTYKIRGGGLRLTNCYIRKLGVDNDRSLALQSPLWVGNGSLACSELTSVSAEQETPSSELRQGKSELNLMHPRAPVTA